MRSAALILLLLLGTGASVLGLALWKNGLPWHYPPGRFARLTTYLTRHVADTIDSSPFPELRPRRYAGVSADQLYTSVERAVGKLGWSVIQRDREGRVIRGVVTTPLLQFQDDVDIAVAEGGRSGAVLKIRSLSRVGQGDLGTNTAHILALYEALDTILPPPKDATWTVENRH